jgi:hypothetical protein
MSELDNEIISSFLEESYDIVDQLEVILESCEENFSHVKQLENFGQMVDRIMGAAKSIALQLDEKNLALDTIGEYAQICKNVGYKSSQIKENEKFYNVCVSFLLDALEVLREACDALKNQVTIDLEKRQNFLDRLKWIDNQFSSEYRASVDVGSKSADYLNQEQIQSLVDKLTAQKKSSK